MLVLLVDPAHPGEMKFTKWWTLINVHEHSWTFINGSSSQFMNCVHELFIKTVHDKSWILMNTWWTNVVHELVHEAHMESFMNSHEFLWTWKDQFSSWKFMREFHKCWWIILNLISLNQLIRFMTSSWMFTTDCFMNCDELLWTWLVSGFPTMPEMPATRPDEFYADQHVIGHIRLLSSW